MAVCPRRGQADLEGRWRKPGKGHAFACSSQKLGTKWPVFPKYAPHSYLSVDDDGPRERGHGSCDGAVALGGYSDGGGTVDAGGRKGGGCGVKGATPLDDPRLSDQTSPTKFDRISRER